MLSRKERAEGGTVVFGHDVRSWGFHLLQYRHKSPRISGEHAHDAFGFHVSGFSPEFGAGHFRMVCLPEISILKEAFSRIEAFLEAR